jgi:hypothetical protein
MRQVHLKRPAYKQRPLIQRSAAGAPSPTVLCCAFGCLRSPSSSETRLARRCLSAFICRYGLRLKRTKRAL